MLISFNVNGSDHIFILLFQVTPPVCLGCYRLLEEDKVVSCEKCGWPFCSELCTKKEVHIPECYYTQQKGEKVWLPREIVHIRLCKIMYCDAAEAQWHKRVTVHATTIGSTPTQ